MTFPYSLLESTPYVSKSLNVNSPHWLDTSDLHPIQVGSTVRVECFSTSTPSIVWHWGLPFFAAGHPSTANPPHLPGLGACTGDAPGAHPVARAAPWLNSNSVNHFGVYCVASTVSSQGMFRSNVAANFMVKIVVDVIKASSLLAWIFD